MNHPVFYLLDYLEKIRQTDAGITYIWRRKPEVEDVINKWHNFAKAKPNTRVAQHVSGLVASLERRLSALLRY